MKLAAKDLLRLATVGSVGDDKFSETAMEDRKREGYF
jgi:hypothetical protein